MKKYVPSTSNAYKKNLCRRENTIMKLPNITDIFSEKKNKDKYRDGRINCETVKKTAIYIDANGNKVILKQNTVSMNSDKNGPNIRYLSGNHTWKKNSY